MQSSNVSNRYQSFSLVEIKRATNELSNILGQGAFGKVYYGKIFADGNNVDVAVKFMSADPERGNPAFDIERKLLSACNHVNIISLVGYCDEGAEKILVYEFMPNGSLFDYLYKHKGETPRLTVEQRLEVCTGVAKGLSYLHSRNDYNIIHSDLKTENILLDANLVPKISDFGLSRTRYVGPSASSIVTNRIQEVLCEKPAWEKLVIWALPFVSRGELPKFTPEHAVKNISLECVQACANLVRDCLEIDPNNRPSMSHVIASLDLALALQKMNAHPNDQKNRFQVNTLQRFSFSDLKMATNEFSLQECLQQADFWRHRTEQVYHGNISIDVAVKRITGKVEQVFGFNKADNLSLFQDLIMTFQKEINLFQNQIDSLSACHHANVISLVGYCDEPDEKILVYEFMPNGLLYDYFYMIQGRDTHLSVEQRLEICLGVAKGLRHLHSSNFVHGYLNSKSILLDRNFVAKITNFKFSRKTVAGLSTSQEITYKIGRTDIMEDYLAPECYQFNYTVSQEADVYAFGVVFLEVLCEMTALNRLVTLALPFIMRGELANFTPKLGTYISRECARACENLLKDCLESDPDKRTFMNQVVESLNWR